MTDLRDSKYWNREVECGLPDCRLRPEDRETVKVGIGSGVPCNAVYCASCHGGPFGYATVWTPHVYFICDGCVEGYGRPPRAIEITLKQMAERGIRVSKL